MKSTITARDDAQDARENERRVVAARPGANDAGDIRDQACAELVSGEDPAEHQRRTQAAEAIGRQARGRRNGGDPIQSVEDRKNRQAEACCSYRHQRERSGNGAAQSKALEHAGGKRTDEPEQKQVERDCR
jgi:hypothetical protein